MDWREKKSSQTDPFKSVISPEGSVLANVSVNDQRHNEKASIREVELLLEFPQVALLTCLEISWHVGLERKAQLEVPHLTKPSFDFLIALLERAHMTWI